MSKEILDAIENVKSVQVATQTAAENAATQIEEVKSATDAVKAENVQLKTELDTIKESQENMEAKMNRPNISAAQDEQKDVSAKAFKSWFVKGGDVAHGSEDKLKAYSTSTGAAGGDAVVDLLDTNLIRLLEDQVVMRSLCNQVRSSNPNYSRNVKIGADGAQWIAEGANVAESDTGTVKRVTFKSGKVASYPMATNEAINDISFNVEVEILADMVTDFAIAENVAFMTGDGVEKPTGLLTAPLATTTDATRAFGTFQKVEHSLTGSDTLIDTILKADAELKQGYGRVLMMNAKTKTEISSLKDSAGNYLFNSLAEDGFAGTVAGIPVVINPLMADVAAGNDSIILGDFNKAYTILDVDGSTDVLRDPYTKPGSVKFYADRRVGGGITDTQALKFISIVA